MAMYDAFGIRVCGNPHAIIRKYGLMCCRQCFRSNAKEIGFIKLPQLFLSLYLLSLQVPLLLGPKDNPTSAGAVARRPKGRSSTDGIVLEDYHQIEPAPSTRAAITSGPIEHGTPIIPYIPRTAPPNVSKSSASPSPAKSPK
ncbi:Ribosomal protein S14 [Dillenia turbinata]|uniref:Ribosomal protein S14 n=1 Tax=Dillenia turbinata TaxID=194707 RepID=A0AAN8UVQ8_9MAGN